MRRREIRVAAAMIAAGSLLASCGSSNVPPSAEPDRRCDGPRLENGDPIPGACIVRSFDGEPVTLDEARAGKPAVLNFWASWCVFCIKEMPDFQRVYERAAGQVAFLGLDLLGVQAETESAAKSLAARTGASYPLAYDAGGEFYRRICPCGGRPLMPATVFVRDDGTIAHLKFGPLSADELTELIETHFGTEI